MRTGLKFLLFLLITTAIGCKNNKTPNDYLKEVLSNLEKIESATYTTIREAWYPGDTTAVYTVCYLNKEYNNPMDSTIGACFVSLDCDDTTKLEDGYDGKIRILVYHDVKGIVVDDFTTRPLPIRPVGPPFFNYTKNIIRYMLNTKDSITVESIDLGDRYYFKLVIHEDRQVEFFGEAYYVPDNPYNFGDPTSIYELWISKSNDLPHKVRREMSHSISATTCSSDIKINKISINDFNLYEYFPPDYEVRAYGVKGNAPSTSNLIGKTAPDWKLTDMYEQPVSLTDFKSKVLLVNFTGIGCGPCMVAIPFLRELKDSFSVEDFDLVAIECWGGKAHSLQNYANKHNINYTFLRGTDGLLKDYQTGSGVPVYFILDKQRVVRKVIHGYGVGTTDKEIMSAITELL